MHCDYGFLLRSRRRRRSRAVLWVALIVTTACWGLVLSVACGCAAPVVVPPPPQPDVPVIVPVDPEPDTIPYSKVSQLTAGLTSAQVLDLLGEPRRRFEREDGIVDWSYPAVDSEGGVRRLEVRLLNGVVVGYVLF